MPHGRPRRSSAARCLVALVGALGLWSCVPTELDCTVCGEEQSFPTCQELYCRYLASASLCATRDLQECYARYECPSPYFLFCAADTRNE